MKTVAIAELKSHLSAYLDAVRRGEEILVRDRSEPIARIVPLRGSEALASEERALVSAGLLRPPDASFARGFWSLRAPRIRARDAAAAVSADRDEA